MNTSFIGKPWSTPRNVLVNGVANATSPLTTAASPSRSGSRRRCALWTARRRTAAARETTAPAQRRSNGFESYLSTSSRNAEILLHFSEQRVIHQPLRRKIHLLSHRRAEGFDHDFQSSFARQAILA